MSTVAEFIRVLHENGATREHMGDAVAKLDNKIVPFSSSAALLLSYEALPIEAVLKLLDAVEADRKRYLNIAIKWSPPRAYTRAPRTKKYGPAQDPDGYWSREKLRAYEYGAAFVQAPPVARLSDKDWWPLVGEVFRRDNFTCTYCGADGDEYQLHCDHIAPISRGGLNELENLTTACDYCNCSKRDLLPHEWRPARGGAQ